MIKASAVIPPPHPRPATAQQSKAVMRRNRGAKDERESQGVMEKPKDGPVARWVVGYMRRAIEERQDSRLCFGHF
jgi:hypothetical protein